MCPARVTRTYCDARARDGKKDGTRPGHTSVTDCVWHAVACAICPGHLGEWPEKPSVAFGMAKARSWPCLHLCVNETSMQILHCLRTIYFQISCRDFW